MSRTALVTGASRGIGRAVAQALAEDGITLVGIHYAQDDDAAGETAELVEKAGATPVLIKADLQHDAVAAARSIAETFLDAATASTGSRAIDVLVNNAGIGGPQPIGEIDAGTYRRVHEINLTAPTFLIQELLPHFAIGGRIVNVSTGFTRIAAPTHPVYAAAKAGLNALTLALAPSLGPRQITINAVLPGIIDTDLNAGWLDEPGAREHSAGLSVFNRVGTTDDVAQAVRYLASEGARWTTGQTLDVSGGSAI